jgi:hypothetical protein
VSELVQLINVIINKRLKNEQQSMDNKNNEENKRKITNEPRPAGTMHNK